MLLSSTTRCSPTFCLAPHVLPFCYLQVTFDLVTEFQEMQKWDAMLISLDVLDEQVKAYPVTHVGTFLSTYGVPGETLLLNAHTCVVQQATAVPTISSLGPCKLHLQPPCNAACRRQAWPGLNIQPV